MPAEENAERLVQRWRNRGSGSAPDGGDEAALIREATTLLSRFAGNTQLEAHSLTVADLLADMGLDARHICAGVVHHLDSETSVLDFINKISTEDYPWAEWLSQARSLRSRAFTEDDFETQRLVLTKTPMLIPLIVASAVDSTERAAASIEPFVDLGVLNVDDPMGLATRVRDLIVPFAHYLHLDHLTWRMEDAALRTTDPERYKRALATVSGTSRDGWSALVGSAVGEMETTLRAALGDSIRSVTGRPKGIFGIANKLEEGTGNAAASIRDLVAFRVVINDAGQALDADVAFSRCAEVLEALTRQQFHLTVGTIRNYIHSPKSTGYQALHFGVDASSVPALGPVSDALQTVEMQVRTDSMHRRAEYGEWAHFLYKLNTIGSRPGRRQLTTGEQLVANWNERWAHFFRGRIMYRDTFGRVHQGKRGMTIADAAAHLVKKEPFPQSVDVDEPSQSGTPASMVPLKATLANPETMVRPLAPWSRVVIVGTAPAVVPPYPSATFLAEVRMSETRRKVKPWFADDDESLLQKGQEVLDETMARLGAWSFRVGTDSPQVSRAISALRTHSYERILPTHVDSWSTLFKAIATGDVEDVEMLCGHLHREWHEYVQAELTKLRTADRDTEIDPEPFRPIDFVWSGNWYNVPLHLGACCRPLPNEMVYVQTAGGQPVVHREVCRAKHRDKADELRRFVYRHPRRFKGALILAVQDQAGMLARVAGSIASTGRNVTAVDSRSLFPGATLLSIEVEVESSEDLDRVAVAIEALNGAYPVVLAERPNSVPSQSPA